VERALDVRPTAATIGGKTSLRDRIRAVENILIGGINNFGDRHVFGAPPQSIVEAASSSKSDFPDGSTLSDLGSLAFTILISHNYLRLYKVWLSSEFL